MAKSKIGKQLKGMMNDPDFRQKFNEENKRTFKKHGTYYDDKGNAETYNKGKRIKKMPKQAKGVIEASSANEGRNHKKVTKRLETETRENARKMMGKLNK